MNGRFPVYDDLLAIRKPACGGRSGSLEAHRSSAYIVFVLLLDFNVIPAAFFIIRHDIQTDAPGIGFDVDDSLRLITVYSISCQSIFQRSMHQQKVMIITVIFSNNLFCPIRYVR